MNDSTTKPAQFRRRSVVVVSLTLWAVAAVSPSSGQQGMEPPVNSNLARRILRREVDPKVAPEVASEEVLPPADRMNIDPRSGSFDLRSSAGMFPPDQSGDAISRVHSTELLPGFQRCCPGYVFPHYTWPPPYHGRQWTRRPPSLFDRPSPATTSPVLTPPVHMNNLNPLFSPSPK